MCECKFFKNHNKLVYINILNFRHTQHKIIQISTIDIIDIKLPNSYFIQDKIWYITKGINENASHLSNLN